MMKFNFQVVCVPGRELQVAAALSRRPQSFSNVDSMVDKLIKKTVKEHVEGIRDALSASKDGLLRIKQATRQHLETQELIKDLGCQCRMVKSCYTSCCFCSSLLEP